MSRSILLPLFGDLGDTILWVPAVRAVRQRYPHARIVALCNPLTGRLLSELGLLDDAICVDKHLFDRMISLLQPGSLRSLWRVFRRIRACRFDTVILFHHLVTRWGALKFAAIALASGAPERIGLDNGRGWFLTRSVRDLGFGHRHEAQYWLDVAAEAGAPGELSLEFPVSEADRWEAERLLSAYRDRPLVAIHPGTGGYGPGRRWPAGRFARLGALIQERSGARVVVVGTDEDAEEASTVLNGVGQGAVDLVGKTTVGTLAAVLELCAAAVANDGGVGHVAAAVGTPVVSVFGPSNDGAWRPIGGVVVAADIPCRPCFYRDFERGKRLGCATRECLFQIAPETVLPFVLAAMRRQGNAA